MTKQEQDKKLEEYIEKHKENKYPAILEDGQGTIILGTPEQYQRAVNDGILQHPDYKKQDLTNWKSTNNQQNKDEEEKANKTTQSSASKIQSLQSRK